MFECDAADRVDDLAAAFAGGSATRSRVIWMTCLRVGKSDAARGGQHFQRAGLDAAVAAESPRVGEWNVGPRQRWMRASSLGWFDFTIIR